jgi:hypothetical protein
MSSKITTVVDDDGKVWTGAEVDTSSLLTDVGAAIVTCGLTAVADAIVGDTGNRTVEVNGQRHFGRQI